MNERSEGTWRGPGATVNERTDIYFPDSASVAHPDEQAAKRDLAALARELVEAVTLVDVSKASHHDLDAALAAARSALAVIGGVPALSREDRLDWPGHEHAQVERGPLSGRSNPVAPPLQFERVDDRIVGRATLGPVYEGAPERAHGGIIAALFDDLLGCVQLLSPIAGPTGTLTVRYRSPSPVGQPITFEGWVERIDGRKVYCLGTAHAGDVLLAEAEAVFIGPAE